MTGKIFLSYRRDDAAEFAHTLFARLKRSFPAKSLFMDVEGGIGPGQDFVRVIDEQVRACDVVLVLIGPNWLTVTDHMGLPRLEDPRDLVRFEVQSALRLGKLVIPVLAPETQMPRADALPEPLKALARLNAVWLTPEHFESNAKGLIKAIEGALVEANAAATAAAERRRAEEEAAGLEKRGVPLGRLPRSFDSRIPHYSALVARRTLPSPPPEIDYTKGMPVNLGMMLSNTLGVCTCAAFYHARQVWSFNASKGKSMETDPDSVVEKLYELACGYKPQQGGEGPGGNIQHVLEYLLRKGAPVGPQGQGRYKINAFVEVDPRNTDDVKRTINDCGLVYIGFSVPQYIVPTKRAPPAVWDVETADTQIVGGHAVVLPGYTGAGARVISWGQYYTMTWAFFAKYVDEAYAISDNFWVNSVGRTPGGLTVTELEQQMQALAG
jgi:TIR domain